MLEWLHLLEDWLAQYGIYGLLFVSFADSSFLPVIPEVLLLPMGIANPSMVWIYALYTTIASVLGALLGWYIGKKLGRPVLRYFISEEKIQKVEFYFHKYGALSIVIAGFTPIPYKVFTIFSGVSRMKIRTLMFWSVIGRGARFFLEAAIIAMLGENAMPFIEKNFTILTLLGGIAIVIFFLVYRIIQKRKQSAL